MTDTDTGAEREHEDEGADELPGGPTEGRAAASTPFRSGFCTLVGRPNVGTSTLLTTSMGDLSMVLTELEQ